MKEYTLDSGLIVLGFNQRAERLRLNVGVIQRINRSTFLVAESDNPLSGFYIEKHQEGRVWFRQ